MTTVNWNQRASQVRWNIRPFLDGRYRSSSSQESFETVNPSTEEALCRVVVGTSVDADEAVRIARRRFNEGCWSGLPPVRRVDVLLKLTELIKKNKETLALLDTLEMGKPIAAALQDVGEFAPSLIRSWAGFADKLFGQSAPLIDATAAFNVYEPRGVVAAITPWNFPLVCAIYKCAPALLAGNTVVLKPSELTASSALKLAELALEAGVPPGVLNVVPGLGTTVGAALALHPDVDMLSFTGSTATGRRVMEMCGRTNAKPLLLECGGKSPHVVFSDVADLDVVAKATMDDILRNQGQVCGAHTRLLVDESVKDELLHKVVTLAKSCQPGDPLHEGTQFGPLASPAQRHRVQRFIEGALEAGARPALKGAIQKAYGCFVSPTIFDLTDGSLSIAQEEIFGPVLCVQGFKTESEAIAATNGTQYGLAATAWTRDMGRAKRMAQAIKAGTVTVRTGGREGPGSGYVLSDEPQKASGFGSEMGLRGLQSYSTLKLVTFAGH
jgi:acyl-CoA reductase-like NAD-dependent aldehyde dehydrogenase